MGYLIAQQVDQLYGCEFFQGKSTILEALYGQCKVYHASKF